MFQYGCNFVNEQMMTWISLLLLFCIKSSLFWYYEPEHFECKCNDTNILIVMVMNNEMLNKCVCFRQSFLIKPIIVFPMNIYSNVIMNERNGSLKWRFKEWFLMYIELVGSILITYIVIRILDSNKESERVHDFSGRFINKL